MPKPLDPAKSETHLNLRVPMELRLALEELAVREDRSVAAVVRRALEAHLKTEQGILDAK